MVYKAISHLASQNLSSHHLWPLLPFPTPLQSRGCLTYLCTTKSNPASAIAFGVSGPGTPFSSSPHTHLKSHCLTLFLLLLTVPSFSRSSLITFGHPQSWQCLYCILTYLTQAIPWRLLQVWGWAEMMARTWLKIPETANTQCKE